MLKTQRRASKKEEAKGKGSEESKGKRKSRQRYKAQIGTCFHRVRTTETICRYRSTICRYRSTICGYRCRFNCHKCPPQTSKRLDFGYCCEFAYDLGFRQV